MDSNVFFLLYSVTTIIFIVVLILLTAFIIKFVNFGNVVLFKVISIKQLLSWVISFALTFICGIFSFDIFSSMSFPSILFYSIFVALLANGIYNITLVQKILNFLKLV